MNDFKVGDEVRVIGLSVLMHPGIKIGDVRTVTATCSNGVQLDGFSDGWVYNIHIVRLKPKWSIYNNTQPWAELSDNQKGKLLLANINDVAICMVAKSLRGDETFINNVEIDKGDVCVYRAQPKPVKPEPTMAELFDRDWKECFLGDPATFNERMIAKGWTKPCK
jgi:hypothetical protein